MIPSTIMVATDGSGAAKAAEAFAADLANQLGDTRLMLVNVIPLRKIPPISPPQQASYVAQVTETGEHRVEAEKLLGEEHSRVQRLVSNPSVSVETQVIEAGSPAKGIIERAQGPEGCRIIVMGIRGHSEFAGLVLGSVSTQVLHGAACPVIVVREQG